MVKNGKVQESRLLSTHVYHSARFHTRDCVKWLKPCAFQHWALTFKWNEGETEQTKGLRTRIHSKTKYYAASSSQPNKYYENLFLFLQENKCGLLLRLRQVAIQSVICALRLVSNNVLAVFALLYINHSPTVPAGYSSERTVIRKKPYRARSDKNFWRTETETGYRTGTCDNLLMKHINRWLTYKNVHGVHYVPKIPYKSHFSDRFWYPDDPQIIN